VCLEPFGIALRMSATCRAQRFDAKSEALCFTGGASCQLSRSLRKSSSSQNQDQTTSSSAMRLLLLSLTMAVLLQLTTALRCQRPSEKLKQECIVKNAALNCTDRYKPPCFFSGGCEACSKGVDEACGGPWGIRGQCQKKPRKLTCQLPGGQGPYTSGSHATGTCQ